jgi:hypothetical protein
MNFQTVQNAILVFPVNDSLVHIPQATINGFVFWYKAYGVKFSDEANTATLPDLLTAERPVFYLIDFRGRFIKDTHPSHGGLIPYAGIDEIIEVRECPKGMLYYANYSGCIAPVLTVVAFALLFWFLIPR